MPTKIHFLLNDREVVAQEPAGLLVLDYLRKQVRLTGTKEGCKEGDCGACVVLVGQMRGDRLCYLPVTSCLMPLGELQGKHLVTIEGLNLENKLTPIQQAIVDEGGTQCGFCTPGIVVSLTGYLLQEGATLTTEGIYKALGGHLCRCTGYASLKRAGTVLQRALNPILHNTTTQTDRIASLVAGELLPAYFQDIPQRLRQIPVPVTDDKQTGCDFVVAGGTDIYVQKGEAIPDAMVKILNLYPEIKKVEWHKDGLHLGALTTFEEIAVSRDVAKLIPDIQNYMQLVASWQIRNRATLGGNIINASPIGDLTALMLALEARLVFQENQQRRIVPITQFYKGYKQLDKKANELLTHVIVPTPGPATHINFEKVSKRKMLDIASVNSALRVRCERELIAEVGISMGGVAPIPLFLQKTCAYLQGKPVTPKTIEAAWAIAQTEIAPIGDIRGSASYKKLLVRQFLIAHFTKLFPQALKVRDFYEAH